MEDISSHNTQAFNESGESGEGTAKTVTLSDGSEDEQSENEFVAGFDDDYCVSASLIECIKAGDYPTAAEILIDDPASFTLFDEAHPLSLYTSIGHAKVSFKSLKEHYERSLTQDTPDKNDRNVVIYICALFLKLSPIFRLIKNEINQFLKDDEDKNIGHDFVAYHKINKDEFNVFFALLRKHSVYVEFLRVALIAYQVEITRFEKYICTKLNNNQINPKLIESFGLPPLGKIIKQVKKSSNKLASYKKRINELRTIYQDIINEKINAPLNDKLRAIKKIISAFKAMEFYFDQHDIILMGLCTFIRTLELNSDKSKSISSMVLQSCNEIIDFFEVLIETKDIQRTASEIIMAALFLNELLGLKDNAMFRVANMVIEVIDKYSLDKNEYNYEQLVSEVNERLQVIGELLNKNIQSENSQWCINHTSKSIEFFLLNDQVGFNKFLKGISAFLHHVLKNCSYEFDQKNRKIIISDVFLVENNVFYTISERFADVLTSLIKEKENKKHTILLPTISIDNSVGFFAESLPESRKRAIGATKKQKEALAELNAQTKVPEKIGIYRDPDLHAILEILNADTIAAEEEKKLDALAIGYYDRLLKRNVPAIALDEAKLECIDQLEKSEKKKKTKKKLLPKLQTSKKTNGVNHTPRVVEKVKPVQAKTLLPINRLQDNKYSASDNTQVKKSKRKSEQKCEVEQAILTSEPVSLFIPKPERISALTAIEEELINQSSENARTEKQISPPQPVSVSNDIFAAVSKYTQENNFSFFSIQWGEQLPSVSTSTSPKVNLS